jgi:DNA-binding MarR family transcriptional regulator/GNAT superfamily N-acetyltransferase
LVRETATFRSFNRMYTRYIGALNEGLLQSEYSLGEARVLYELATRIAPSASEIADALGLDAGYLSRMVAKFEGAGLLRKRPSLRDGRCAELKLTARGKAAFKKLNARAEENARAALQALKPAARDKLLCCMKAIEARLAPRPGNRTAYRLRPHRIGDMGWVVSSESIGYARQFGWNQEFEALAAKIVSEFVTNFDSARERCWIAEIDGQRVGHIFLVRHLREPDTAKLRLLFVDESARGMGLGDALVGECICFARAAGYRKVVLWTQSMLTAAHRIYQRFGFHLVKEEPHHSFGHDLVGQEWELQLT